MASDCKGSAKSYFSYWGKAKAEQSNQQVPCHLLPYHSLDVAAVGQVLLEQERSLAQCLADDLGMDQPALSRFFVYSLALHDVGKFARSFQSLAQPAGCALVQPDPSWLYDRKHDSLGRMLWEQYLVDDRVRLKQPDGSDIDPDVEDSLLLWMGAFFGHHGKPVATDRAPLAADFLDEDITAARTFATDVEALFNPDWPMVLLADADWREQALEPASWRIAGLSMLVDWIGSNAHYFRYCANPTTLSDYWHEYAVPRAHEALAATGLLKRTTVTPFPGFNKSFGFAPTPLQVWAETVELSDTPQLFLFEDITGAGKTEAALTLTHRLLEAGLGQGLYFGLPTMATSNAMFLRVSNHYRSMYMSGDEPSLILAHGARHLNEAFMHAIVPEPNADAAYSRTDTSAGIECRSWLADNRKKALLAEVGVGTIDQALLGILPRKHQALRLLGLANKVLIVDEVHAYDSYTTELLQALLSAHAAQGGCVIMLSATMPSGLKETLLSAWYRSRDVVPDRLPENVAFPLATHADAQGVRTDPVACRAGSQRRLPVRFVHDSDNAQSIVIEAAWSGRCVCWIRNTVDDAIQAYDAIQDELGDIAEVLLFHARFTMADRQRIENEALARFGESSGSADRAGRILIATQVVEQSLDLDFDMLVTDLAPIELLIQRAGRLQRHRRDAVGNRLVDTTADDGRESPVLHVLAPEWQSEPPSDWVRRLLPGTSFVYANPALLWRTCRILREEGAITLPERARVLLESVYGENVPLPVNLEVADAEHYAGERTAASNARFNALEFDRGYVLGNDGAGWDDDQEIGTRLSNERTIRVVVVQEQAGQIRPLHDDHAHPWAMSTFNLRESLAHRLPALPERLEATAKALQEQQPGLRYLQFWLPGYDEVSYNTSRGAVIPRRAGN